MPSQPLTATPPFFQSVLSLFSRKAFLPILRLCSGPPQWTWLRARVNPMLRLTPHANARGYIRPPSFAGPGRARPFHRVIHDAEQEESDAAAHHGEGRLGRADRPRRHRGGRLRPLHHDAGPAGGAARHRRHRAVADAVEGAGDRRRAAAAGRGAHRRRLRRGRYSGAHRARHSADGGRHGEFRVGRRARDLHDVWARQEGDVPGRRGARRPLAGSLEGRAGRPRRRRPS